MENSNATYIRVYGYEEPPIMLPRYTNNRLVMMEFCIQISYLRDKVWKKENATFNLSIRIGEYSCTLWKEVQETKKEILLYGFLMTEVARNYDPKRKIHQFCLTYKRIWSIPITHQTLGVVERYRNVIEDREIIKLHQELLKTGRPR